MNKQILSKNLLLLACIIMLVALLSKVLFPSSETLSEYAQNNPELAYPNTKDTPLENPVMPDKTAMKPDHVVSGTVSDTTDNFYYEPLSDTVINQITGISYPTDTADCVIDYSDLCLVHVLHYDFANEVQEGTIICNQTIAQDLTEIFHELYLAGYTIEQISPIDSYQGDDLASMTANNTSCFNYRVVEGTTHLSLHAYGMAIDINPLYNPYVTSDQNGSSKVSPIEGEAYADRTQDFPHKIDESDLCYKLFTEHGFTWGGNWKSCKDYQHFQKSIEE